MQDLKLHLKSLGWKKSLGGLRRNQKCTKFGHFFNSSQRSTIFIFLKKAKNLFTSLSHIQYPHYKTFFYTQAFGPRELKPQCHVEKRFSKRFCKNIQGIKIQLNKSIQRSECKYRMGQGYIQYNPPHVVSYLGFICTRQRLSKLPSFCCLHDTIDVKSETWGPHVDYVTSNVETIAFDVSPAMVSHLTSYYRRWCVGRKLRYFSIFLVTKMKFTEN